jgi:hypothetical protein
MTTTALIVNIVLIAAVTAIVALPAVLIPLLLGRAEPTTIRIAPATRAAARARLRTPQPFTQAA